jgi:endothelin-converting enzyme
MAPFHHRAITLALFLLRSFGGIAAGNSVANVCSTKACQDYAKFLKDSFDSKYESMNACEDMDKYSCNGWRASQKYRPDQTSVSVSSVMSDTNTDLLHAILEGPYAENTTYTGANRTADEDNFKKMKIAYNACMKEDVIKAYGVAPMKKILEEFNTQIFPAKGNAKPSAEELTKAMSWLYKKSVGALGNPLPTVSVLLISIEGYIVLMMFDLAR